MIPKEITNWFIAIGSIGGVFSGIFWGVNGIINFYNSLGSDYKINFLTTSISLFVLVLFFIIFFLYKIQKEITNNKNGR